MAGHNKEICELPSSVWKVSIHVIQAVAVKYPLIGGQG